MARNKYPEQTVKRILEVSSRLFYEKGYEATSIQDIVAALGMSKGAIYHHFKSKQEILEQVSDAFTGEVEVYNRIRNDRSLTGLQKLYRFFCYALSDREKQQRDQLFLLNMNDPQVIAMNLKNSTDTAAAYVAAFLEEGKRDGSMTVEQPLEAAQVILLLFNYWLNPGVKQSGQSRYRQKLRFMKALTDGIGIPLMDERLTELCSSYYARMEKARATE